MMPERERERKVRKQENAGTHPRRVTTDGAVYAAWSIDARHRGLPAPEDATTRDPGGVIDAATAAEAEG
jgi:hypothetical protein